MKLFFKIVCLIVLFFNVPRTASANDFEKNIYAVFEVDKTGKTKTEFNVEIKNLVTDRYIKSYALSFAGVKAENIKVSEEDVKLFFSEHKNITTIEANFENALVGRNKTRKFKISFEDNKLAEKTGEVWEINLPSVKNLADFESFSYELRVPASFGKMAYSATEPSNKIETSQVTITQFDRDKLDKSINLIFGKFQVFAFSLNYHLINPVNQTIDIPIAIPPDTAFQKVIYKNLSPAAKEISIDQDGNWIAIYEVKAKEKVDVKAEGSVQIYTEPRYIDEPGDDILKLNLAETANWQINDPFIKNLDRSLTSPKDIYDFVSTNLVYDYSKVKPNVARKGAKEALQSPQSSICLDFSDAFVALARAAGIPAREVNGYAYSEDPEIEPLSLVSDVLHAWPEYWDSEKKAWIPIDPTWAATSGGDYFSNQDLKHFAFVKHGLDSEKPYPPGSYKNGANPEKDVFVSFSTLPTERTSVPQIKIRKMKNLAFTNFEYEVTVNNPGPVALYNQRLEVYFDNNLKQNFVIDYFLPFTNKKFDISAPMGFFASKAPEEIRLKLGEVEESTFPDKKGALLVMLTITLAVILAITLTIFLRFKKHHILNKAQLWRKLIRSTKKA